MPSSGHGIDATSHNRSMSDTDLRAWFDEQTATSAFRGVAIAWRDGAPIFEYAGGLAHRGLDVPVTLDTRFGVASVTKLATAVATLRLVDRGLLRLDQPLVEVLPGEQQPVALTPAHTLHHLLSHTSGLASYFDDDDPTWASWLACWDRIPTYHVRRPADLLPLFVHLPARAEPGAEYRYCDANFVLVGLVIEAITGRPFGDVLADEVFGPADMRDTAIESLDDDPRRVAVGYRMDDGPPERWKTNTFALTVSGMPDGGMNSTPYDLARLVDAILGGRLLPEPLVRALTSPQGPNAGDVEQYGYGCELAVVDGRVTVIGHGGSDPGVSAMLTHHLDAGITLAVVCNQDRGSWAATMRLVREYGLSEPRD
jgi:CubicO group peptidase (beta-lactamase class C family)